MQLAFGSRVPHLMANVERPDFPRSTARSRSAAPIIDQDGREIRWNRSIHRRSHSTLPVRVRKRRRLVRQSHPRAAAGAARRGGEMLDIAFIVPGTKIRYGIDGIIGLIPVVGDVIATAFSLWLVREARALGAPWHVTARMSATSRSRAWSEWCVAGMPSTSCSAPTSARADAAALDGQAAALAHQHINANSGGVGVRIGAGRRGLGCAGRRGSGNPGSHTACGCRSGRTGLHRPADRRRSANPPAVLDRELHRGGRGVEATIPKPARFFLRIAAGNNSAAVL